MLTVPSRRRRFPVIPAAVGLVIVGGIAAVAAVFAVGGFDGSSDGGGSVPAPEILVPAPTSAPGIVPTLEATATSAPIRATAMPIVGEVLKEVLVTANPGPTPPPNTIRAALPVGSVAFRNHYYLPVPDRMSWNDAVAYAESLGGHLVTISDESENRFVADLARETGLPQTFWIGLTDEAQEGTFLWVTGESSIYSNWSTGEPNNSGNEDYVTLGYPTRYTWNDLPVDETSPFVVEFEAEPDTGATAIATPSPSPVPTPRPTPTSKPVAFVTGVEPYGSLNLGFQELGSYQGHPALSGFPQREYVTLAAYESLFGQDVNGDYFGKLAEEWSVAPDLVTWTFNLKKGVPLHGDWGEVNAEDVLWSIEQSLAEDSRCLCVRQNRRSWLNPEGYLRVLDDYTLELNTGIPAWDVPVLVTSPGPTSTWVVSKMQAEELAATIGQDEANSQLAGTGPWQMVEHRGGEFWKFKAVADHYRKALEFAEMTFWEMPEEATRIASFQVGKIDTFQAAPDKLSALTEIPGTKFMTQANSYQSHLGLYGSWYEYVGTPDERPGYNPDLPWVSSNPDPESPEWEQARKVRLAMRLAIDRQTIIDELLRGEGTPLSMWGWAGHEDQQEPHWKWEYDPERAKQLLAEAGYADGFELELTPARRGAPAEFEACQAVAAMWEDIGVISNMTIFPYSALRPDMISRTLNSITCHSTIGWLEPVVLWGFMYDPEEIWSSGLDHPFLNDALDKARNTFGTAGRWEVQQDTGHWIWENALDIGLYTVNAVYPLGPKLDGWAEHLETGDRRRISGLEWAPHRK